MITRRTWMTVLAGSALALASCQTAPPPPMVRPAAFTPLGVSAPYLSGDVIGGHRARAAKMRAAKIRPLPPAMPLRPTWRELDRELRQQTAGIGLDVLNLGGSIVIRIPATFTFDTGSSSVKPQTDATLLEIARTVKTRNQTFVDVLAHTDTTGTPQGNLALSEKRAAAVATYLAAHGVAKATDCLARTRRDRCRCTIRTTTETQRQRTGGSRSGSSRTSANAAPRRSGCSSSADSPSPIPPSTSGRWWHVGWAKIRAPCTTPPPLGSSAPNRSALSRATDAAAAHMAHGSSVTHKVHSSRREVASAAAAARIASISACAVGSRESRIALRASATISSPRVTTAPTGTSPAGLLRPLGRALAASAKGAGKLMPTG